MSENKESGSLNQDDIAKLLNEMQSEADSSGPEETKPSRESENNESSSLSQDDISRLLNEAQNEEMDPALDETPDSTKSKSSESSSLNQDDISRLLNEAQSEEMDSAPDKKSDSTKKSNALNQDDISSPSAKAENPEKVNEREKQSEEMSDNEIIKGNNKGNNSVTGDDSSFEGLDSISDDDMEMPDDEMDIDEVETAAEPAREVKISIPKNNNSRVILQEVTVPSNKKRITIYLSLFFCILFGLGSFVGYQFYIKPDTKTDHLESSSQPEQPVNPANRDAGEPLTLEKANSQVEINNPTNTNIVVKLEEITNLRRKLAIKEDEIAELVKNYKDGIHQMEAEILKIKHTHQINTLHDALKNKKIEFGMMTIQRRLAYIESIKQPYEWLNQGIEELQYLKNKIEIDSQISRVISGIDMDKMVREIDVVLQEYRTGIETLQIQMNDAGNISLETIWKKIVSRENTAAGKKNISNPPQPDRKSENGNGKNKNQVIWKEICNGYFRRKNEMTALSVNAAKCLSEWRHADLILNGLVDLSPKAAKQLLKWKGNWICLNGIKKLSPATAEYLFQWKGNLISLNGLPEISSGMAAFLPHWQGKQLELMGLKYKKTKRERAGLKALAAWEASGGKLYIPVEIRKVIQKLN